MVGRYEPQYDSASPHQSLLTKVTRYGSDGVNLLPPISFTYSSFAPAALSSAADKIIASENTPPKVKDNELVELIDLNRDGLTDILKSDLGGISHRFPRFWWTGRRSGEGE